MPRNAIIGAFALALTSAISRPVIAQDAGAAGDAPAPVKLVDQEANSKSIFTFNYGPPASPSIDLLGFSSSKVTPANSPGPFVLSLPSIWDGSGGQFAGLDISPFWLFNPHFSYEDYVDKTNTGKVKRELTRLMFDVGITNGQKATDPAKQQLSGFAFGLSIPLLDQDDPRMANLPWSSGNGYFFDCFNSLKADILQQMTKDRQQVYQLLSETVFKDIQAIASAQGHPDDQAGATTLLARLRTDYPDVDVSDAGSTAQSLSQWRKALAVKLNASGDKVDKSIAAQDVASGVPAEVAACQKGGTVIAATNPDITLGIGIRDNGRPGEFRDLDKTGGTVWLSGRLPLFVRQEDGSELKLDKTGMDSINKGKLEYLMLGGSIRYDIDEQFLTGNKTIPSVEASQFDAWLGLEGYNSWGRLGAQYGYSSVSASHSNQNNFNQRGGRWLTNAAVKLGDTGVWLGATYGNANGTTTKLHDRTFLLTLYFSPPDPNALFGNSTKPKSGGN